MLINFGITSPTTIETVGTNAKMNEFEAAMGLCILDEIDDVKQKREDIWQAYLEGLQNIVVFQKWNLNSKNNHAYAPVLFKNEAELLNVDTKLKAHNIMARRYFYPSLDTLKYLPYGYRCSISRDIASRVLCMPIFPDLNVMQRNFIIEVMKNI